MQSRNINFDGLTFILKTDALEKKQDIYKHMNGHWKYVLTDTV